MRSFFRIIPLLVGIALLLIAVFAEQIGLDNDSGWGKGRILLLASGLIGVLGFIFQERLAPLGQFISKQKGPLIAALIVATIYVWLSQLNVKQVSKNYNYFSELAMSFKRGTLYLAEEPSPELLSLSNPYDHNLRFEAKVPFIWDVSLYNKKYYLYWGPVPSLLLTIYNNQQLADIGDEFLTLRFAFGVFLYAVLIAVKFFDQLARDVPRWFIVLATLILGLCAPATIMLVDSRVYEAAIFGCQFFFIGGCYWAYAAISNPTPPNHLFSWQLILAGIHWALALGTRITILPTVFFAAAATIVYIAWMQKITALNRLAPTVAAIGLPLLLALAGLGWYNWARFGSVTEFGIKYQLANMDYSEFHDSFSGKYVANNLFVYFAHPLKVQGRFPYLVRIENLYSNERLGGLLFMAPYIVLTLMPLAFRRKSSPPVNDLDGTNEPQLFERWLITIFSGSALISLMMVLAFWFPTMRYMEDFMPSLLLLATIQVGRSYHTMRSNLFSRRVITFLTILLAGATIIASTLVALKENSLAFGFNLTDSILSILRLK